MGGSRNPALLDEMHRSPWIERRLRPLPGGVRRPSRRTPGVPRCQWVGLDGPVPKPARVTAGARDGTFLDLLHSHEAGADLCCSVSQVEFVPIDGADATEGRTARPLERCALPSKRSRRAEPAAGVVARAQRVMYRADVSLWRYAAGLYRGTAVGGVVIPRLRRPSRRAARALRVGRRGSGRFRRRSRRIRTAGRCTVARSVRTSRPDRSGV